MITEDLASATALSGKAAKAARREGRRESWSEFKHKDLVGIFALLSLGVLMLAMGAFGLVLADPDVDWGVRIPALSILFGLWVLVTAGLVGACGNAVRTRERRY